MRLRFGRADARDVAEHVDSERQKNLFREPTNRHARSGFARRRPFEHVANIFEIVFQHARQVGMAGPRARDDLRRAAIAGIGRHLLDPVLEVAILDDEGDRTAERFAEADARNRPHLVLLDQHPAAAAVAFLPTREVGVDRGNVDVETGGYAFDRRDQLGPVRFTGSQKSERHAQIQPDCTPARKRVPRPNTRARCKLLAQRSSRCRPTL